MEHQSMFNHLRKYTEILKSIYNEEQKMPGDLLCRKVAVFIKYSLNKSFICQATLANIEYVHSYLPGQIKLKQKKSNHMWMNVNITGMSRQKY